MVDFLLFHQGNWYFPAFNVADSAITVGAVLLILDELLRMTARRASHLKRRDARRCPTLETRTKSHGQSGRLPAAKGWPAAPSLLGVSGGVAAYKSAQLVRDLQRAGATVQVVMTEPPRTSSPRRPSRR